MSRNANRFQRYTTKVNNISFMNFFYLAVCFISLNMFSCIPQQFLRVRIIHTL